MGKGTSWRHENTQKGIAMQKFLIALGIGIAAGALDIVPMALRRAELVVMASPFVHWVVTALVIAYIRTPLAPWPWAQGSLVAVLSSLPVLITYSKTNPQSVLPILGISIVLGALVGLATAKLAV
jgi:hypothetical protein